MLRLTALLSLMAVLPVVAHANTVISLASTSCSGAMSTSSLAGASLSCAGNLSLDGGLIDSHSSIFIRAEGDLLLENLNLNVPEVSLSTIAGHLQIASSVNIQATQNQNSPGGQVVINPFPGKQVIDWKSFDIKPHPGGNIQVNMPSTNNGIAEGVVIDGGKIVIKSAGIKLTSDVLNAQASVTSVPEANTGAMLLLGLCLLAWHRRTL